LKLSVSIAATIIKAKQQLISEDGCHGLGLVDGPDKFQLQLQQVVRYLIAQVAILGVVHRCSTGLGSVAYGGSSAGGRHSRASKASAITSTPRKLPGSDTFLRVLAHPCTFLQAVARPCAPLHALPRSVWRNFYLTHVLPFRRPDFRVFSFRLASRERK